jgi:hypothetical protein
MIRFNSNSKKIKFNKNTNKIIFNSESILKGCFDITFDKTFK